MTNYAIIGIIAGTILISGFISIAISCTSPKTLPGFTDWFLPSRDELLAMYDELHLHAIGEFSGAYWQSTEYDATYANVINFTNRAENQFLKSNTAIYTRACRTFTSAIEYDLRDAGPSGGWIFYKSGTTYMECAATDQSNTNVWSNVSEVVSATGTAIGTGQANTTLIIAQTGHTTSAAKLCNDLIV